MDKSEKLEHYVVYHGKARKASAVIGWPKFLESSCTGSPADTSYHWLLLSGSYPASRQSEYQLRRFEIQGSATLFSNISNNAFRRQILDIQMFCRPIDKKFEKLWSERRTTISYMSADVIFEVLKIAIIWNYRYYIPLSITEIEDKNPIYGIGIVLDLWPERVRMIQKTKSVNFPFQSDFVGFVLALSCEASSSSSKYLEALLM